LPIEAGTNVARVDRVQPERRAFFAPFLADVQITTSGGAM
jgi:hypothetical protein